MMGRVGVEPRLDIGVERPDMDARTLLEAKIRCPVVVQRESPPELFVHMADGDRNRGRIMQCRYWNNRKMLLGEMAFQPVSAINNVVPSIGYAAAELVRTGWISVFPGQPGEDSLVHIDQTRLKTSASLISLKKAVFYGLSTICKEVAISNHGCSSVVMLLSLSKSSVHFAQGSHILDIIYSVLRFFPVSLHHVHVLLNREGVSAISVTPNVIDVSLLADWCLRLYSCFGSGSATVHTGTLFHHFEGKLLRRQIAGLQNLASLGGRLRITSAKTTNKCAPKTGPLHRNASDGTVEVSNETISSTKERNKIYSRRKYYRKKIENQVLEEQAASLTKQNSDLLLEFRRLEALVQDAHSVIKKLDTPR